MALAVAAATGAGPDPTPNVQVQVAFTNDPLDAAPAWTTVATAEQVQTHRGGAYQQAQVQAGTATVEIDNAVPDGGTGALYTPGNAAGRQPTPDRPVQILVTAPAPYAGTTYPIHTGNADAWEARLDAAGLDYSKATVKSVDGFLALAGITLRSTLAAEILADNPVGYYPLGEQAGATTAGNLAPPGGTAHLGYQGVSGGAAAFGGTVLAPSDPATALAFGPHYGNSLPAGDGGVPLTLPNSFYDPGAQVDAATGFTVSCVFSAVPVNQATEGAFLMFGRSHLGYSGSMFEIYLDKSGNLKFLGNNAPSYIGNASVQPAPGYRDGKAHMVHAVVQADGTQFLYLDGVRLDMGFYPAATGRSEHVWAGYATENAQLSSYTAPVFFEGQISHVALFSYALAPQRVRTQYQAFLGFPNDLSGTHINRILDYAGDTSPRVLDPGRSTVGPMLLAGQTALSAIQTAAADEQGLFFKDGAGRSVFQDRGHRQNAVSKVTLNIADDTLPVEPDIIFQLDRTFIRNDITGSRPGGAVQRVQDATSQRQHRRITEPSPLTINLPTDDQVLYALQWRLLHMSQPQVRIPQCSIKPVTSPALWPWALGLEVGDQITLANLPPTAPAPTMNVVIDAIDYGHVTADEWIVTFMLSPAEPFQYLRADGAPSAHTKLDSGLKIGW